eukprot:2255304-Rhodomonas_salina.1
MIEDAVESADLGNRMRLAKFFEGEFEHYIDEIVDVNLKLTNLNQNQPEQQLVNEILQHMLAWTLNQSETPAANAWSNFIDTFNKERANPAKYTLVLLEYEGKAKERDIQNAQAIAATLGKTGGKRKMAAMQASGDGDTKTIWCYECGENFTIHCTYCHCDNHYKRTCNYWSHDTKNGGAGRGTSPRGRGRGRGRGATPRGRGGSNRGGSSRGGRSHGRGGASQGEKKDRSQLR